MCDKLNRETSIRKIDEPDGSIHTRGELMRIIWRRDAAFVCRASGVSLNEEHA
jgi:hypothetical protein